MNISNDFSKNAYSAVLALLVYQNSKGQKLCTINGITRDQVLPGTPVDAAKLAGLFNFIGCEEQPDAGKMIWRNQRLLASGPNSMLWYAPPCRREIFFACTNLRMKRCNGKIFPYPGLVFLTRKEQLLVYAVKSRPNVASRLYHAPFWNISIEGKVCLPNDARGEAHTLEEWENIFYMSAFSHPGTSTRICRTELTKLVPSLIKSKAAKFPSAELIPDDITVRDLLEGKRAIK